MANDTSHKSLEPLLNDSTLSGKIAVTMINNVGACSHRTAVSVTATAQAITIGTSKRTIEIFNSGDSNIYYGGSGVSDANGIPIFPDYKLTLSNVKDDFSIYLVCATGETSTAKIVEYS